MSQAREVLTWEQLGSASRELAAQVAVLGVPQTTIIRSEAEPGHPNGG